MSWIVTFILIYHRHKPIDSITLFFKRERERRESLGGGDGRHYRVGGGVIETEFGSLEGSQAVPASPSGKGEACIRDLFNFDY
jgi:hypothetical protein